METPLKTLLSRLTSYRVVLLLSSFLLWACEAVALSPQELLVVFNRRLPDSEAVATYYAQKRKVPPANLVGVALPTTESISRQAFENDLLPPVRQALHQLQGQGKSAAVLLVYGVPLRVEASPITDTDRQFTLLVDKKIKENLGQVENLSRRLDHLTMGEPPPAAGTGQSSDPDTILKQAVASLTRATAYLTHTPADQADTDTKEEVNALILQLIGIAGKARTPTLHLDMPRSPGQHPPTEHDWYAQFLLHHPELTRTFFWGILPDKAMKQAKSIAIMDGEIGELQYWLAAQRLVKNPQTLAAVDSELTLALVDNYQKGLWLPNPWLAKYDSEPFIKEIRERTVMVGRLDGPTPAVARRLVDDALAVEKSGLGGVFYIDARGIKGSDKYGTYAWYDQHLIKLYHIVKNQTSIKVVLDQLPQVFPPGACPDAALYCGWYSLAKYVPAFRWRKGAVAYHVASSEATTLKQPDSQVWCKRLLEEGVAATLGPVAEPYLHAFPLPDDFFPILLTGKLPLLEVYFRTLPHLSWRLLLIGDPLYRPFQRKPALKSP